MKKTKIGIIREDKVPVDRRVPLTPTQARQVLDQFSEVEIVCQSSTVRIFSDAEYESLGIPVVDTVEDCDVLLGVKEVPNERLIENKTYFFFSHTIKKQAYNQKLLQTLLKKNIRMVDYECLTDEQGKRIIAFGRYAGIVGAYNGLLGWGKRYNFYDLLPAHQCYDLEALKKEYKKFDCPPIKIALTGGGRVSKGAMEVLHGMGILKVTPGDFLQKSYTFPVFCQLNGRDYHQHKEGKPFNRSEFYQNPDHYEGDFIKFAQVADLLIAGAFWDPKAPVLFTREDCLDPQFRIRLIADITCDIEGSIPSTKRPSTIDKPFYDYNPSDDEEESAFSDEGNITVMAVDNLPCELPRDASQSFGNELIHNILPHLLGDDSQGVISRATITDGGALTKPYAYLQDFADGK